MEISKIALLYAIIFTERALGFISPLPLNGLQSAPPATLKNIEARQKYSASLFVHKNERNTLFKLKDNKASYADWKQKWLSDGLGTPTTAKAAKIAQINKTRYGNTALINSVSVVDDVTTEEKAEESQEENRNAIIDNSASTAINEEEEKEAERAVAIKSGEEKTSEDEAVDEAATVQATDEIEIEPTEASNTESDTAETIASSTTTSSTTSTSQLLPQEFFDKLSSIRHRTDSNSVTIYGTKDTPANKAIWAQEVPPLMAYFDPIDGGWSEARDSFPSSSPSPNVKPLPNPQKDYPSSSPLDYEGMKRFMEALDKAWQEPEDAKLCREEVLVSNPEALLGYMEAYMYQVSSLGILQAVRNPGLVSKFTGLCRVITNHYPELDQGVGFCYQGGYRLSLPWPFGNKQKAVRTFLQAIEVDPQSKRNLYYTGVAHYATGKFKEALQYFEKALEADCTSASQEDIKDFLQASAAEGAEMAKKKIGGRR